MAELRTLQGHTLLLPEGCVSIGADPANDVPVAAHLGLAPIHFRLQPWEGGHFLEDAGSGLGTLVNGHSVNWKPLTHGDVIVAGELEVVYGQQAQAATSPIPVVVSPGEQKPLAAFPPPAPPLPAVPPPLPVPLPAGQPPMAPPPLALSALAIKTTPPRSVATRSVGPPPAWLPVDLLPESYPLPSFKADPVPASHTPRGAALSSLPSVKPPQQRSAARSLLRWAAVCAVLVWAGHTAWQRGHFTPLLQSLGTEVKEVGPMTDPSLPAVKADSIGLGQPNISPTRDPSALVGPEAIPKISSQMGR